MPRPFPFAPAHVPQGFCRWAMTILLAGCFLCTPPIATAESVTRMRPMLGTYVEMTAVGNERTRLEKAMDAAFSSMDEVDRLLSSHRPDSELNQVNQAAGQEAILVSPWTFECISEGIKLGRESQGTFDITLRPLLDAWGFVWKKHRMPSDIEISSLRSLVDWRKVNLLHNQISSGRSAPHGIQYRVGLNTAGMKLDVGGIGKGFAVDKAVETLRFHGVHTGLVRAGGDLMGFGNQKWRIGIPSPKNDSQVIREFEIQNEAVSTAGDYQNYFEYNRKRYAHILDPRTGWPVPQRHSVTVKAPRCTLSDGWSTALFVNPSLKRPDGIEIMDQR